MRTRIAPTPSGYLHEGNAFNFLLTFRLARQTGASVALRIDDVDAQRMRPEYLADIFRSLEWLDLQPDSGPTGPDDFLANFSQSLRLPLYEAVADDLYKRSVAYPCICSRKDIERQAPGNSKIYPGTCRGRKKLPSHKAYALRVALDDTAHTVTWPGHALAGQPTPPQDEPPFDLYSGMGDFVVWRKDGLAAYQLASLVDDLLLGTQWMVRGADLRPSTAAQMWLAAHMSSLDLKIDGLGVIEPSTFLAVSVYHHPLIDGPDGQKLSKSAGAKALHILQKEGRKNELLDGFETWCETLV